MREKLFFVNVRARAVRQGMRWNAVGSRLREATRRSCLVCLFVCVRVNKDAVRGVERAMTELGD